MFWSKNGMRLMDDLRFSQFCTSHGTQLGAAVQAVISSRVASLIVVAALAFCLIALTACGGGGSAQAPSPNSDAQQQATAGAAPAQPAGSVEVKTSVDDYSWAELKIIAAEISAAGDEAAAVEVAKQYNLVGPNGQLDGTQTKMVGWQGSQVPVQIIGFAHDDKSDGTGKAGITFQFVNCIDEHKMNPLSTDEAAYNAAAESIGDSLSETMDHWPDGVPTNLGGWEASDMRAWLNDDVHSRLPEDLTAVLTPVDKQTFNAVWTEDTASVTTTSDMLWLPSCVELWGKLGDGFVNYDDELLYLIDIYNAEGSEYKLFRDMNVDIEADNNILTKYYDTSSCSWWGRTSGEVGYFVGVGSHGGAYPLVASDYTNGIAPCFCI